MTSSKSEKKYITVLFILHAALDYALTVFNLISSFLKSKEEFLPYAYILFTHLIYEIPLFVLIFLSRKVEKMENVKKLRKIKKYFLLYIYFDFFILSLIIFFLKDSENWIYYSDIFFYGCQWLVILVEFISYSDCINILSLCLFGFFFIICILFINRINCKIKEKKAEPENIENFKGEISSGYKIGIANIILMTIQSLLNLVIAYGIHHNTGSAEQAIGIAFAMIIFISIKIILAFIILPVIPLSIIGLIKGKSAAEIQDKCKKREEGIKINTACLIIAILELIFVW